MIHDRNSSIGFSVRGFPALIVMLAVMVVDFGIPAMRVARRVGFPSGSGLLAVPPVAMVVSPWVCAFRSWPLEEGR